MSELFAAGLAQPLLRALLNAPEKRQDSASFGLSSPASKSESSKKTKRKRLRQKKAKNPLSMPVAIRY